MTSYTLMQQHKQSNLMSYMIVYVTGHVLRQKYALYFKVYITLLSRYFKLVLHSILTSKLLKIILSLKLCTLFLKW